jgi:hypothetical protein
MPISRRPSPLALRIAASRADLEVAVPGSRGATYVVRCSRNSWSCTCKAYEFGRGEECKHIKKVKEDRGGGVVGGDQQTMEDVEDARD